VVVSANPANVTPNVASGAVYKLLQVAGSMYAGGAFGSVSTPARVGPGGTFARVTSTPGRSRCTASPSTRPTWINYTGGDTAGPGAVSRPGIGGETRRRIALLPVP
jgi:hypothetical protein